MLIAYLLVPNRLGIMPGTIGIMAAPGTHNQSQQFLILNRNNDLLAPDKVPPARSGDGCASQGAIPESQPASHAEWQPLPCSLAGILGSKLLRILDSLPLLSTVLSPQAPSMAEPSE